MTVPDYIYKTLFVFGILVLIYHLYKMYNKYIGGINPWINWIHIILVAPLLLIIGYYGKNTTHKYFDMLFMLGIAATGYHSLQLIRSIMLS